jgi:formyl-CoA transferase
MQPAAFFDLQGGSTIAGAVATALFARERTGEPSIVDISLMNVAMWTMAPDIVSAPYTGDPATPDRFSPGNPLVNWYRTADGRWLYLVLLHADRFWRELCQTIGCERLIDDPRFVDASARYEHRRECVDALDKVFGAHTLDHWCRELADFSGVWAPVLSAGEVRTHVQVGPNGFLPEVSGHEGGTFRLVAPAMHFNETPTAPRTAAPEAGQHTEEVLLDTGLTWDGINDLRDRGALG